MIKIKTDTLYQKIAINSLKKKVKDWAYSNLNKTTVFNKTSQYIIEFNKRGLKHTLFSKLYSLKQDQKNRDFLISCFHLKELLSAAKYIGEEPKIHDKRGIIKIHIFVNSILIDTRKYEIRIVVREVSVHSKQKNILFFYDHSLNIKK